MTERFGYNDDFVKAMRISMNREHNQLFVNIQNPPRDGVPVPTSINPEEIWNLIRSMKDRGAVYDNIPNGLWALANGYVSDDLEEIIEAEAKVFFFGMLSAFAGRAAEIIDQYATNEVQKLKNESK